jgi:hypothetical protein
MPPLSNPSSANTSALGGIGRIEVEAERLLIVERRVHDRRLLAAVERDLERHRLPPGDLQIAHRHGA